MFQRGLGAELLKRRLRSSHLLGRALTDALLSQFVFLTLDGAVQLDEQRMRVVGAGIESVDE